MYMPRLRARQHEVFAVRNCASSFAASSRVVPVLEPVAAPNDLFTRRLGAIADEGGSCDLVLNRLFAVEGVARDRRLVRG